MNGIHAHEFKGLDEIDHVLKVTNYQTTQEETNDVNSPIQLKFFSINIDYQVQMDQQ